MSSPEAFLVALHDGPSRVRLGTLDGVAAADCIEDLEDTVFCQLEDLLHIHPFQRNNPSGSLLIPVPKENVLVASKEKDAPVLEVVEAPIVENKPTPLPDSPLPTLIFWIKKSFNLT